MLIDSFNYGDLCSDEYNRILHNINGNVKNPVFGVDSDLFDTSDFRYAFTKTSRRMELDMLNDEALVARDFENLIIFGSSLRNADYSYFFSIFDKIKISDINNPSKNVFAFSICDEAAETKIKNNLIKSIFRLFHEYAIYKGNAVHPNRLLDALTTQGKVLLYQID